MLFPLRVLGFCRAGLQAEAVVSGLDDVASVGEPIEESGSHLCVAEDGPPFAEAEIGRDDDAGSLVELAQQVEEQRAARGAERQVFEFVQDDEIGVAESRCDLPGPAL